MRFKFVLYLIFIILSYCGGCIPTPQAEPPLCVNPCSLSGARVAITAVADASCASFTASATCTVGFQANADMQFNGAGPNYAFPQALICDATTGIYTFTDMGGVQQPANSIECICRASPCGYQPSFTPGQTVLFTPPEASSPPTNVPDSMCYYHHLVTCTDVARTMIRFQNDVLMTLEDLPNPQTVFCPAGYTGYLYRSADGTLIEAYAGPPDAAIFCPP